MSKSKIEWTDTTWNPITGCTKISDGCRNCYAERMSKRLAGRCGYPKDNPFQVTVHSDKYLEPLTWRKPRRVFVNSMSDLFHSDVQDDWILAVFVAMGLTYEHTGEMKEISPGHKVGIHRPKHTFMILTKRPERMRNFINRLTSKGPDEEWDKKAHYYSSQLTSMIGAPLPGNAIFTFSQWIQDGMPGLWLGVSVENQAAADERIPLLLKTPAAIRFISVEPLIGPVVLRKKAVNDQEIIQATLMGLLEEYSRPVERGIDWVIVGGESGPGARPMHSDWARSLLNQCQAANVPFFFKQFGEFKEVSRYNSWPKYRDTVGKVARAIGLTHSGRAALLNADGSDLVNGGPDHKVYPISHLERVGKKEAGRELDGRTWDEFPEGGGIK